MKSSIKSTPFIIPAPLGKGCRCEAMTPPWKFPRPKWEAPVVTGPPGDSHFVPRADSCR
jgi:hypothetical protein